MKRIRRFAPSPAMVVAMIALFVALTGTAVATTSALITGKQIKNSSITGLDVKNKSLTPRDFRGSVRGPRGLRGPAGPQGPAGAQGAQGIQGIQGPAGPLLDTLPAGRTLRGEWSVLEHPTAGGQQYGDSITFQLPLSAAPIAHYIDTTDALPAGCSGTRSNPGADPGHLCIFEGETANAAVNPLVCNWTAVTCSGASARGFTVVPFSSAGGLMETNGTWAVTASAGAPVADAPSSGPSGGDVATEAAGT